MKTTKDTAPSNPSSLMQKAIQELKKTKQKLLNLEAQQREPIAIIGMSCRMPQGANTPEKFWESLCSGQDTITEVPKDRWDIEDFFDPNPDTPGKMCSRWGSFLHNIDQFDASFFGISPREAAMMDPQQRILLEVAWEVLENAGINPRELTNSATGTFLGMMTNDYFQISSDPQLMDGFTATGSVNNAAAGRLAHHFGFQGPTLTVDTACSSSLVALHLGCQSLKNKECDLVLTGGVNLILTPLFSLAESRAHMLSADGRCKTFDAAADGYVRGEGCGLLLLKRFSDAKRDQDSILALIPGSAINHDGASSGLTVPNPLAQVQVIQQALDNASLTADQISYVEAHGSGTPLGDPIEFESLEQVFAAHHSSASPLLVGSVKTNIGHLESAAGIAALLKVILALQHRELPPHLNFKTPNSLINWEALPFKVVTKKTRWDPSTTIRTAGISSFGFSGSNAHILLQEAPVTLPASKREAEPGLLILSAKSKTALRTLAERYHDYLQEKPTASLAQLCANVNCNRSLQKIRLTILAKDIGDLQQSLGEYLEKGRSRQVHVRKIEHSTFPKVAFLFSGQGAQYTEMGKTLYQTQPKFRKLLRECDSILHPLLGVSLLDILYPSNQAQQNLIHETRYTQPALFSLEYALAKLWQSWGIFPKALMGHSLGEYVAACVAGVFSLEDGLRLVAERGRLMHQLPQTGSMISVYASVEQLKSLLTPYADQLAIAAINGPASTVISGKQAKLTEFETLLQKKGIFYTALQVSHAFHSPLMEPLLHDFKKVLEQVTFSLPKIKLISNLSGTYAAEQFTQVDYWLRHVLQAVNFEKGIQHLKQSGISNFLEIGPSPTLLPMAIECLPPAQMDGTLRWLPSLQKNRDDLSSLLETMEALQAVGYNIDWPEFYSHLPKKGLSLPNYPFQRKRHWIQQAQEKPQLYSIVASSSNNLHPLLGREQQSVLLKKGQRLFQNELSLQSHAYLADHRIWQESIFPGSAYVETALAAGKQLFPGQSILLENLRFQKPLLLSEQGTNLQCLLTPQEAGKNYSFEFFALSSKTGLWASHATGNLRVETKTEEPPTSTLQSLQSRITRQQDPQKLYQQFATLEMDYGPNFQAIHHLWQGEQEILAAIELPSVCPTGTEQYYFHPILLDACLQSLGALFPESFEEGPYIPSGIESICLSHAVGRKLWVHARRASSNAATLSANLQFYQTNGKPLGELKKIQLQRTNPQAQDSTVLPKQIAYQVSWQGQKKKEALPIPQNLSQQNWLIFEDSKGWGKELAKQLQSKGAAVSSISPTVLTTTEDLEQHSLKLRTLLNEYFASSGKSYQGIFYLWGLEESLQADAGILSCGSLMSLMAILHEHQQQPPLWVITNNGQQILSTDKPVQIQQSPLWGMAKSIVLEHPEQRLVCLDLKVGDPEEAGKILLRECLTPDQEDQIAWRHGTRYTARLTPLENWQPLPQNKANTTSGYRLSLKEYGNPDHLRWQPQALPIPEANEVVIQVKACGLNFKDVLNTLGMLKEYGKKLGIHEAKQLTFGFECSGIVTAVGEQVHRFRAGDEVIGALSSAGLASYTLLPQDFVIAKPKHLSFEEAASFPLAYLTSYYGLKELAKIKKGDRVLIHSAAGGVGQAAIAIARQYGAEIYATASPGKWEFLRNLGIKHIMNSRTLSFAEEILQKTAGQGVDLVLNSLPGEYIDKSFQALAQGGRFVEIGQVGILHSEEAPVDRGDVAYFAFDIQEISRNKPEWLFPLFQVMEQQLQEKKITFLPHRVFPAQEVSHAFQYMAQAKQKGKIVIQTPELSKAVEDTFSVKKNRAYLITGGLGTLGLTLAEWLINRGAKHLILISRNTGCDKTKQRILRWQQAGIQVEVHAADVANDKAMQVIFDLFRRNQTLLAGVIHAAGTLEDGLVIHQSWSNLQKVMQPKIAGAWNLHQLTKEMDLDFMVYFSSAAALLGISGQASYGAANSFMDALANFRRAHGLPALSINWSPWAQSGMVASQTDETRQHWKEHGLLEIESTQGLEFLERALERKEVHIAMIPLHWQEFLAAHYALPWPPYFSKLATATNQQQGDFLETLKKLSPQQRREALIEKSRALVADVLGHDSEEEISLRDKFSDLGMDSLTGIELKNRLEKLLSCHLSATLVFNHPTLLALVDHLESKLFSEAQASSTPEQLEEDDSEVLELDPSMQQIVATLKNQLGEGE